MAHTVTGKLNKDARTHAGQNGTTFFVSIGEKNFDFKTKQSVWTNYEAAIFAKDNQAQFYQNALVAGSVISVSGGGIIAASDEYGIKLAIQDARLEYVNTPESPAQRPQQQAPSARSAHSAPPPPQQIPQAPRTHSAPPPPDMDAFDDDIPF